ncbi:5-formyltetrahydrofolate cyclo-ligase [Polynucleobacter sp. 71A-WALBACH]|uniref:5-formyltetrahydrofolate cyclo-ligase n=1 Tax=Polynucleobacter sp. 71A-WALBACH TaxID=2689097 RepID=UPI001C0BCFE6|nr:5-formyltetrahydrofolate cyclo-ligase [Polynucleobacter sp. 71A-WALBACH]MBU3592823.1 5-formyltetrahydrofolate cyclo-ligase [Polynucleobacter sp. 71A-WALBACH]
MASMHGNSPKTLRQDLLAQRKQFVGSASYATTQATILANLTHFLADYDEKVQSIALYCPIQDELDLRPTLLTWAKSKADKTLALPFARPDKHLEFYTWQEADLLIPSRHGVPEPDPNNPRRSQVVPDCILIPCVGWSESTAGEKTQYWRLGYGGGYFDRTLAQLRKAKPNLLCVGIGFNWQKLNDAQWQAQTHDEPLDAMLTESGLVITY